MPLVFDVIDDADGGGVIGCDNGGVCDVEFDPDVVPAAKAVVVFAVVAAEPEPLFALLFDVVGNSSEFRSKATLRTAPTRSLAMRDQDSMRLWASQQAAGPKPLIICENILANCYGVKKMIFKILTNARLRDFRGENI